MGNLKFWSANSETSALCRRHTFVYTPIVVQPWPTGYEQQSQSVTSTNLPRAVIHWHDAISAEPSHNAHMNIQDMEHYNHNQIRVVIVRLG